MKRKTIPFIILGFLHILLIGYTWNRKKEKTLVVLMSSIGIGYVFEYFVLNVFKMYRYYPKVFKNDWIDSVFGGLLSQAVFVPIKATFLTLFRSGWKWKIGAGLFFGIIERLFIFLGVFKNNTWSTFYTVVFMPIYFRIVQKWWDSIETGKSNKVRIITVFFSYLVSYTNIYFLMLALFKNGLFHIGLKKDKYWEHFILGPIYTFYLSIIGTIQTFYGGTSSARLVFTALLHASDQFMYRFKVIRANRIYL